MRAKYGDAPARGYQAAWHRFDNNTSQAQAIGSPTSGPSERLPGPSDLPRAEGTVIKISVSAVEPPHAAWATPVEVYFRRVAGTWKLVGVERLPAAQ